MSKKIDRDDPAVIEAVLGELLLQAAEAREDPIKFFEFVMRTEKKERVTVPAHMRAVLRFLEGHAKGVLLLPRGHGKTWLSVGMVLYELGKDPLLRIGFFGSAEEQAKKVLKLIGDYIETSYELRLVFPRLKRATVGVWNDVALTVERPSGIKDPSVQAFGIGSERIRGNRLDRVYIDDIISEENSSTAETRAKLHNIVQGAVMPCLVSKGQKSFFVNTAKFPDDTVHKHAERWPTMVMKVDGTIMVRNTEWDTDEIYPADSRAYTDPNATYRLAAHLPDRERQKTLWPEVFPKEAIESIRYENNMSPQAFAQEYMNECRDDASSFCKNEYIEKCMRTARMLNLFKLVSPEEVRERHLSFDSFGGVDLAFSKESGADESAIVVLGIMADPEKGQTGKAISHPIRAVLWIEHGRWDTKHLRDRVIYLNQVYRPFSFGFESNAAQEGIRQLIIDEDKTVVLKPHRTDATKNSILMGIPSMFGEMANGAWAFPNTEGKPMEEPLKAFVEQCLAYNPKEHTGDILMAGYFAREQARYAGALSPEGGETRSGPGLASTLLSR